MSADPKEIAALRPSLLRYAHSLNIPPWAAEDLVQNAICRALTRAHLYQPTGKLFSWVACILHNEYVSSVRANVRRATLDMERAERIPGVGNPEIEAYAHEVVRTLQAMPKKQRDAITLVADGWSYEAISEMLDQPTGTTRSRISRGRVELRYLTDQA